MKNDLKNINDPTIKSFMQSVAFDLDETIDLEETVMAQITKETAYQEKIIAYRKKARTGFGACIILLILFGVLSILNSDDLDSSTEQIFFSFSCFVGVSILFLQLHFSKRVFEKAKGF